MAKYSTDRTRDPEEAPYKPSRAALRNYYGTRRIDGRAPQSARDSTPSGRIKYLEQSQGYTPEEADFADQANFENKFRPRPAGFERPQDRPISPWAGVTPIQPSLADQVQQDRQDPTRQRMYYPTPYDIPGASKGGIGWSRGSTPTVTPTTTPTPLAFNLSEPSTLPASTLSQFAPPGAPALNAPQAYVPPWRKKQQNGGYMGSILGGPSKWLT